MSVQVDRKVLRWGNGYGIRLTAAEMAALGAHAGETVHVTVGPAHEVRNDVAALAMFRYAGPIDIKAALEEEAWRDQPAVRPRRRVRT